MTVRLGLSCPFFFTYSHIRALLHHTNVPWPSSLSALTIHCEEKRTLRWTTKEFARCHAKGVFLIFELTCVVCGRAGCWKLLLTPSPPPEATSGQQPKRWPVLEQRCRKDVGAVGHNRATFTRPQKTTRELFKVAALRKRVEQDIAPRGAFHLRVFAGQNSRRVHNPGVSAANNPARSKTRRTCHAYCYGRRHRGADTALRNSRVVNLVKN